MMIDAIALTPINYSADSRDYQYLARVFSAAFNYSKTAADMVRNCVLNKNSDIKLLDLFAKTLGFESRREYGANDLRLLCMAFKDIMRLKGSKQAVESCIRVLLKAQDITAQARVTVMNMDESMSPAKAVYNVTIMVPETLTDLALLEDMMDYVLPAGYTYSIVKTVVVAQGNVSMAGVQADLVSISRQPTSALGAVRQSGIDVVGVEQNVKAGMQNLAVVAPIDVENDGDADQEEQESEE